MLVVSVLAKRQIETDKGNGGSSTGNPEYQGLGVSGPHVAQYLSKTSMMSCHHQVRNPCLSTPSYKDKPFSLPPIAAIVAPSFGPDTGESQ